MQAQATRPHILERAPAQFRSVYPPAFIHQNDLESFPALSAPGRPNAAERHFDGAFRASGIRVTNDVRQCFIEREDHGPAFRFGESEPLGELRQGAAHHAEARRDYKGIPSGTAGPAAFSKRERDRPAVRTGEGLVELGDEGLTEKIKE